MLMTCIWQLPRGYCRLEQQYEGLAFGTVVALFGRRRKLQRVDSIYQPSLTVDAFSDQLQCTNRRGDVRCVPSDGGKTECRRGQERSRGCVGKRASIINIIQ